jgi:hypothetical protein
VALSKDKKGLNLEKNHFSTVGRTVRVLGVDSPRAIEFYLISEVSGKSF